MSGPEEIPVAFLRAVNLAEARGAVPDDGSGIDGVWTAQVPDALEDDQEWFIAINADDEEREYELPTGRELSIDPFIWHFWYDVEQVVPAAMLGPGGGQQLHSRSFEGTVEDRLIASLEAALDELGFEYEEVAD